MRKTNKDYFYGARLRLARTFQGLTLAELGEQVSASRQYIQRLESNQDTSPSEDMLLALSEVLCVDPEFFYEPLNGEVSEDECHFRKLKTTSSNLRIRALSYGTIFSLILSYLEKCVDFPDVKTPSIKVKTREDIERAAEKCRLAWGLRLDAPIKNVTRTLECFGCVITTFEGVSDKIDAFSYHRFRPIIVRSLDKGSSSRARFDLAHECGHIVMHSDLEVGNPEFEDQANQFASAFLLPRVAFIHEFPKFSRLNWQELFRFKLRWGVSIQAIIRRAYDLRLINAIQYRNANVYISRNGWRHGEPPETEPPVEKVEVVPAAIEVMKKNHCFSILDIAKDLHMHSSILERFGLKWIEVNSNSIQKKNGKLIKFPSDQKKNFN